MERNVENQFRTIIPLFCYLDAVPEFVLLVNDYPLSLSINDFIVIYNLIILIKN